MSKESSSIIDDAAAAFIKAPEAIVVKFEATVLLDERMTHGPTVMLPADPVIATDAADFVVTGIIGRTPSSWQGT